MKRKVFAYLHTHWDREWYRSHEEFSLRLVEIVDEIINELKNNKAPSFYFDGQTDAIETYLKFRPENKAIIKKFIKEKKIFIGPFFASADSFLSSGHLLIKNFERGLKYSKDMGEDEFLGYLADTFGHSSSIFEILKYLKINNAILWRGTPDIESDFIFNDFKTTRLVRGYFFDFFHNNADVEVIEENIDKIAKYTNSENVLLPIGADHLQILTDANKKIKNFNKKSKKYEIILTNPFEYIKNATFEKKYSGEFLDNASTYILQGVYSARIPQKIKNAYAQFQLSRIVEPLSFLLNKNNKKQLEYAFETLIKNHAHDSLYGCSIDEVHRQVEQRFDNVIQISDGFKNRIKRDLKNNLESNKNKKEDKLCVINLSNFNYDGVVKFKTSKKIKNLEIFNVEKGFPDELLYDKSKIPVTEDYTKIYEYVFKVENLKPFSLNTLKLNSEKGEVLIGDDFIENKYLKITINDGILNIQDKVKNKFLKDFLNIVDTEDSGDSYNFAPLTKPECIPFLKTKIIKKSTLSSTLGVYFKDILLEITLDSNAPFVKFKAKIKNKKKNHKIQAKFNLENNINETVAECAFGTIKREHDFNYNLFENLPVKRPYEAKTNIYPMQRFVCAKDVCILTFGLNEYEIYKNTLSIAFLRSFGIISNPKNPARAIPAGPPLEVPDAQLLGEIEVNFAFSFVQNELEAYKMADSFYEPVIVFNYEDELNSKDKENVLFQLTKNNILYGLKNKKTAICFDIKENKIKDIEI